MKVIKTDLNYIIKTTQNQLIQSIGFLEISVEASYNSTLLNMSWVSDSEDLAFKTNCFFNLQLLE